MVALSIGDILTASIYIPTHIIVVHFVPGNSCIAYSIEKSIAVFLGTSAAILTTIICMDRFIIIRKMFGSMSSSNNEGGSKRLFAAYCIVTYLIALSLSLAVIIISNSSANSFFAATIFSIVSIILYFAVLLLSLVFNTLLVRYIRRQSKEIEKYVAVQKAYQNKATKTVLMISAIQISTIMPWVLSLVYTTFELKEESYLRYMDKIYYMHVWLKMPMFLNSFLNAIVFIRRNRQLMKFYGRFLGRIRGVSHQQSTSSQSSHVWTNTHTTSTDV